MIIKSKLTEEQVRHVAKLARLSLTEEEVKKFKTQLSEVLEYFEILKEIDTQQIESTNQVTGLENIFREDRVGQSLSVKDVLSGTKSQKEEMFKVGAIFEWN